MRNFAYLAVDRADTAVETAARLRNCRFLAGGTNLVDLMKEGVETPAALIDIGGIPGLADIGSLPDGGLRIGALVRNADLARHQQVELCFPMLSLALLSGASAQIRNMASVSGNLLQRTRCWYFVTPGYSCNKKHPGDGCAALDGVNREHAVLGTSVACVATHPSDMCVALAALDATVVVLGTNVERRIPFADFHLLPGDTPELETVLRPGELITAVELPADPLFARSTYVKLRDRSSYQFALASAATALKIADGRINRARLALGGVATKPWRAREAEALLIGREPSRASFALAAETALAEAEPLRDNAFKIELAKGAIVRAFLDLVRPA